MSKPGFIKLHEQGCLSTEYGAATYVLIPEKGKRHVIPKVPLYSLVRSGNGEMFEGCIRSAFSGK